MRGVWGTAQQASGQWPSRVDEDGCKCSRVVLCFLLQSAVRLFGLTLLRLKQDLVSLPEPLSFSPSFTGIPRQVQ